MLSVLHNVMQMPCQTSDPRIRTLSAMSFDFFLRFLKPEAQFCVVQRSGSAADARATAANGGARHDLQI
jgi:hypothetical protein